MRDAQVTPEGARIRWVEMPGDPRRATRVYLHGLGASAAPYFAASAAHPALAGHRSLLVDLLGFGISDRPTDFAYTLEDHADTVAAALEAAEVQTADVIGHSMGGAVAIVLAARHPHLVGRLVLVDAALDPVPIAHGLPGASGIAAYTEEEFLVGGWRRVRENAGPHWWSTMRLAGREALYRSATHRALGTEPALRDTLLALPIPRAYLRPEADQPLPGAQELAEAGVEVVSIPDCGHNIMLDNPEAFARATAHALRET
ncbi:alpha/beta fold hydrolase [Streptomyces lavendulae]|uniref:2-hydroxymuconate semialdehyde hydrolase n=1 Tax=Streptomyces lavendulae subsp. lavendulae TaxID=58340 RepID=A0A2K8PE09_STRLA|nr:alpha/beta hydrolase [Streptomyces lavendulae]ATZ24986.1 2-hydroxymuconate semialdehyde hydrolase [Streptomyces lavendulae subsp. lavendulae]QUQ54817.1 2-succinyl-6-hydroxy-2,4-cyclohexadiene-1-carboxylate synthase [Streptomyces lavendulae subsp. lavendulae]